VASVPDSTTSATLVGVAVPQPGLRTDPGTELRFEDVAIPSTGNMLVTVINGSGVPARPYAVSITGPDAADFVVARDDCTGTSLSSCELNVLFTPSAASGRSAELVVNSGNLGTLTLRLTGRGFRPAKLEVSPSAAAFGPVFELTVSDPQTFTVTNSGTQPSEPIRLDRGGADVGDFYIIDQCAGVVLAAGSSCSFVAGYQPRNAGTHTSIAILGPPAGTLPTVVTLTGTATPAQMAISPAQWDFGGILIGQTTAPKAFLVENIGATPTGALSAEVFAYGAANLSVVNDGCTGSSLAPGARCSVSVQATAYAHTPGVGRLIISSGRGDRTLSELTFFGHIAGPLGATPSTADFGSVLLTDAPTRRLIISNVGDRDLGAITVSLTGADAASFSLVDECTGHALTPLDGCDLRISLAPSRVGAYTASIQLTAPGSTLTIPVTANVLPP